MALRAVVSVEIVAAEPVETGIWCPQCSLPSGVRLSATLLIGGALRASTFTRCHDCAEPI